MIRQHTCQCWLTCLHSAPVSVLKVKIIQLHCHSYFPQKNKKHLSPQLSSGQNKRAWTYHGLMNMEQLLYLANAVMLGHYANIFPFLFMLHLVIAKAEPLQC